MFKVKKWEITVVLLIVLLFVGYLYRDRLKDVAVDLNLSRAAGAVIRTDFLDNPHDPPRDFSLATPSERASVIQHAKSSGYTHIYIDAFGWGNNPFDLYADQTTAQKLFEEVTNAGLKVMLGIAPEGNKSHFKRKYPNFNAVFQGFGQKYSSYVDVFVIGVEADEVWSYSQINSLGKSLRSTTSKGIYVHFTTGVWGPPGSETSWWKNAGWATGLSYQYENKTKFNGGGFIVSPPEMTSQTQALVAALNPLGKKFIAGEYAYKVSESRARAAGTAAMKAGANGFMNGGPNR